MPVAAAACQLLASFAKIGAESGVHEEIMSSLAWSATLHAAIIGLWGLAASLISPIGMLTTSEWGLDDCWSVGLHVTQAIIKNTDTVAPQAVPAALMLLDRLALLPELAFRKDDECLFRILAMLRAPESTTHQGHLGGDIETAAAASYCALVAEMKRGAALLMARLGSSILGVCAASIATRRTRRRWQRCG